MSLNYPDTLLTKSKTLRALQVILSMWARGEKEEVKVKAKITKVSQHHSQILRQKL